MYKSGITVCIAHIPTRAIQLQKAIDSVNNQTLKAFEIIVETDFDHTGAAATKNRALAKVKTEWVAFLDDDDEFLPNHLETLYNAAIEQNADVVYPMAYIPQIPAPHSLPTNRDGLPFDAEELRKRSFIYTTSLYKTDLAIKVGGFQCPPNSQFDDWGLFLGLLNINAKIYHVPEHTFIWNHWGDGTKNQPGNTSGDPGRWSINPSKMKKPISSKRMISIYYHVYSEGMWGAPVTEFLTALQKSGLRNAASEFHLGIVGNPASRAVVKRAMPGWNTIEADSGWEQLTLDWLTKNVVDMDDGTQVLYAHSKGAAFSSKHSDEWRKRMTFNVVNRWEENIAILEDHDVVGIHWLTPEKYPNIIGKQHFGGNFWWANCSYLKCLPSPLHGTRYDAEVWIGEGNPVVHDWVPSNPSLDKYPGKF